MTSTADTTALYEVRLTTAPTPDTAKLEMGDEPDVEGALRLTTRYVERGGTPWIPVMGEYQFSRDVPENWERELRKIRAGGIDVLATYAIWIIHEETRGDVRWDGHRNLRQFIETAHRVGLKVVLRMGPWVHGETRNGGFPDWVQALPIGHRSNDPEYLALARGWYTEIEQQVRGLFHSKETPDAPIIGVQVDNELYDQPDHLSTLRDIAESVGIRASLWTATGWGGAQLPTGRLLPLYAGYSDAFWEEPDVVWPSFGPMHFAYNTVRDDLSVGMDLRADMAEVAAMTAPESQDPWPFATCELGGGAQAAYHRRPVVDADDVAALSLVKLGSGSAWQGFYLYHGANQVIGEHSSTQESHSTGSPNDLPVRDYDFGAPISNQGVERRHYHLLRQQHLFIHAYGDRITRHPAVIPAVPTDALRWSVRGDANSAFLFFNNHQPAFDQLPPREDVQFTLRFDDATIRLPHAPTVVPSGAYAAWPVRQRLGNIDSVSATAQPITEIATDDGIVVLLAATPGVRAEAQFEGVDVDDVDAAEIQEIGSVLVAYPHNAPGLNSTIRVGSTTLVFLDPDSAASVWKGDVDGKDFVALWNGTAWFSDDSFVITAPAEAASLATIPALDATEAVERIGESGPFATYRVTDSEPVTDIAIVAPAPVVAPVTTGGSLGRYSAPTDLFDEVESIAVPIDDDSFSGRQVLLRVDWVGDVIRAYAGAQLIADQFWFGGPFEIDLNPYRAAIAEHGLSLKVLAIDPHTPVFVDPRVRPKGTEPVVRINGAQLVGYRTIALS